MPRRSHLKRAKLVCNADIFPGRLKLPYGYVVVSSVRRLLLSVLGDVVNCMFNTQFIDELFKPQPAYHQKATRVVFDRLAHSSIMRLNKNSMDKVSPGQMERSSMRKLGVSIAWVVV